MKQKLLMLLTGMFFLSGISSAQDCLPTGINGATINFVCNQTCSDIGFQIPHLKSTSDYSVIDAGYNPYPYLAATGAESPILYNDDRYSDLINLPFPFCFYDSIYTKAVVGSNGLLSFDETNANCFNAYKVLFPIPNIGGLVQCATPADQTFPYYPRASIMGAYSDLDPRINPSSPADRKIQWHIEGTAPCRKFVFSFYHIAVFFNTACGAANPNTFQIVIHESTGIIEVFFEQKACFSTTSGNNGNAILGIQSWARDKAVAAPGKNLTQWSENNTGYRFIPSGGASRFVSSELWPYNMSAPLVLADTATTTAGLLDINFKNFCPSAGSNKYIVRNVFSSCTNPAILMVSLDTIIVNSGLSLNVTASSTNSTCLPSGSVTVTVPIGTGTAPYMYTLDAGTAQPSNSTTYTFTNLTQGAHTITVTDATGVCSTVNTTVGFTNDLTLTTQSDQIICEGTSKQLQLISNATQFTWTPAIGLSSTTISNPVANPITSTQYIVKASLGQCSLIDTMIVNVNAAPIADAGPDGFICFGQTYQLQGSGGTTYSWSPSTFLSNPSVANPIVTPGINTVYSLTTIGANGCPSVKTDDVSVTVTPPIQVTVSPADTIGYTGDQFQLLATSIAGNYTWSPSIGLSNINIADPVVTLGAIGDDVTYTVVASALGGCKGEGFVRIQVYKGPDVYVPTGFTPNGDGKNDKFIPIPVAIKQINYFRISNRWGQLIFSTTRQADGWDGKFAGIEQPGGVYVWMLQAVTRENHVINKKGTVALIR